MENSSLIFITGLHNVASLTQKSTTMVIAVAILGVAPVNAYESFGTDRIAIQVFERTLNSKGTASCVNIIN